MIGSYAVASDTGRRRRRNEDNYVVAPPLALTFGPFRAVEMTRQMKR